MKNEKCKSCTSCGMPLTKPEEHAMGDISQPYCSYCTDKKGKLLPYDSILEMNAKFYQESQGITMAAATQMANDLLKAQPAWKTGVRK